MYKFKRLIFVLSIFLGLLTTYIGHSVFVKELDERSKTELISLPIAKHDLDNMAKITMEDIRFIEVEPSSVAQLQILNNQEDIVGKVTKVRIQSGSPFLKEQLLEEDGGIPFRIEEGKRAITLPSSPIISVGGYLKQGHHVDVYWTFERDGVTQTMLVLQNIKVLALGGPTVDQLNTNGEEATITVSVTPKEAQNLILMNQLGSINLALRGSPLEPTINLSSSSIETIIEN